MLVQNDNNVSLTAAATGSAARPAPAERGNPVPTGGKDLPPAPVIDISHMVEQINDFMSANSRNLRFHVDSATRQTVISVVNPSSGELIRQIPSEEALRLAAQIEQIIASGGSGSLNLLDQLA